jgi:serine/threonine protein kinase
MSPEQVQTTPIDARSDMYSLACVMYETLTGTKPYNAKTIYELMDQHLNSTPERFSQLERKPKVSAELETVVFKALEKDQEARYQNAGEMRVMLEQILRKERRRESIAKALPRMRALVVAGLAAALGLMCMCANGLDSVSVPASSHIEQGRP